MIQLVIPSRIRKGTVVSRAAQPVGQTLLSAGQTGVSAPLAARRG